MKHKPITYNKIYAIKGIIPALSQKYSEKGMRDIAIESHIEKYKNDFKKISSINSNEPK